MTEEQSSSKSLASMISAQQKPDEHPTDSQSKGRMFAL